VELLDSGDKLRFIRARDGDHLVTPFQCNLCHFCNIMGRDPIHNSPQDVRLQKLIRRANLDALWSREPNTVRTTLMMGRQGANISASLGFKHNLFKPMGPFPVEAVFEMAPAICYNLHFDRAETVPLCSLGPLGSFEVATPTYSKPLFKVCRLPSWPRMSGN